VGSADFKKRARHRPSKDDSERSLLVTVSVGEQKMAGSANGQKTMKRVVVDHFGGPVS